MDKPIIKRAASQAEDKKLLRAELDQLRSDINMLRGEVEEVLKIFRTAPEQSLSDMDARALLHFSRAQKVELLATIDMLSKRVEELEKK